MSQRNLPLHGVTMRLDPAGVNVSGECAQNALNHGTHLLLWGLGLRGLHGRRRVLARGRDRFVVLFVGERRGRMGSGHECSLGAANWPCERHGKRDMELGAFFSNSGARKAAKNGDRSRAEKWHTRSRKWKAFRNRQSGSA
jgi:hypothetical protein